MAKNINYPLDWYTVIANSTTAAFCPATPWMDAATVGKVRVNYEVAVKNGDIEVSAAYQTANVENSPDAAVALGSYANSNGNVYASGFTDITSNTQPKQLIRLGWLVKTTSSSNTTFAFVSGLAILQECS